MSLKQRLEKLAAEGPESDCQLYLFVFPTWSDLNEKVKRDLLHKPTSRARDLLDLLSEEELEIAYARWLVEKGE